jgi:two-component system, LuxR family, response regulator FixJ
VNYDPLKIGVIAIVDDEEPFHEALESVMKAAGFPINTFSSAEDFLNSPHRENTACLILDVRLPRMSGIELQRRLLADNSRMPIIFISGHTDASLRDIAMSAGAIDFLSKPVRSNALLKAIRSALATRPDQGQ